METDSPPTCNRVLVAFGIFWFCGGAILLIWAIATPPERMHFERAGSSLGPTIESAVWKKFYAIGVSAISVLLGAGLLRRHRWAWYGIFALYGAAIVFALVSLYFESNRALHTYTTAAAFAIMVGVLLWVFYRTTRAAFSDHP